MALADLNGDGYLDLAVANHDSNDLSILLNDTVWAPNSPASVHHQPSARPATPLVQVALASPQGIFQTNLVSPTEQSDAKPASPKNESAQPAQLRLQEIQSAQPAQVDVVADLSLRDMTRHTMFAGWGSPIEDELVVCLTRPSSQQATP